MAVGMLRGKSEQTGDSQGDPSWHGFRFDPEGNPGHHHDQTCRNIRVEEVIAQPSSEFENHFQAGKVT